MKYMGLNEIREQFLAFFEQKEHLREKSAPLVPIGDNSLLLINSGMAPLKPYFTGEITPPKSRMTTCQKCIRTPDIERVGKTSRHGTFFEMLGNFSFGDYFKEEAMKYAWEFITQVMEIPLDKLWVSIYLDDDNAYKLWVEKIGVDPSRIVRLGKADNFWEIGSGPCGPCSEIYFDRGIDQTCENKDCAVGCDCDRYVEFWNLVFSEFNNDGNGNYTELEQKNIDTGMGLERLACIMQGVDSLFDVDTVKNITSNLTKIAGVSYGQSSKIDVSLRVITDHIRSTTMMVCDGVIPSNEGRGYVLRRLLRRAARHGKLLGIDRKFLNEVCETVIKESGEAYPELLEKADYIKKIITVEEEKFDKTIDSGLKILEELMSQSKNKDVSGKDVFKLYDTYGFPLDLTLEILEEKGYKTDVLEFEQEMKEQKERARSARASLGDLGFSVDTLPLDDVDHTLFVGYDKLETNAKVLKMFVDGKSVEKANVGQFVTILLDKTTFYAESGGQTSDIGVITNTDGLVIEILNLSKTKDGKFLHVGEITQGEISLSKEVLCKVDKKTRNSTARAHSAAHILHKALKVVVGDHVNQAGSYVTNDTVRFDFTHFEGLTTDEIQKTEDLANEIILNADDIFMQEMSIDDAKKLGATALFGEKYGDVVRVVSIGDFSVELCGGTHIDNVGKIGLIKIKSESSVAAGVRRIEAVTGNEFLKLAKNQERVIQETCELFKTIPGELSNKAVSTLDNVKELQKKVQKMNARLAYAQLTSVMNVTKDVCGVNVLAVKIEDAPMDTLKDMTDNIKGDAPNLVAVIASVVDGKINFVCSVGKEALAKNAHAGKIIKEVAAITGGGGGGKPDTATAGGKDVNKLEEALEAVNNIVEKLLG